ncbi:unnamed protein product [Ilex paraguariensis]|uniref:NAC domain-containing protein n=1 Tax=Ilex paraguariensis TaxID=185542 RepID=A0ABC8V530_9AQUA
MHEYRVSGPPRIRKNVNDMKLDDFVLCRLYKKVENTNKNKQENEKGDVAGQPQSLLENPHINKSDLVGMNFHYNSVGDSNRLVSPYCGNVEPPLPNGLPENHQFMDVSPSGVRPICYMPPIFPTESFYEVELS